MVERNGIFAGDDPFAIARDWLEAAGGTEINDPEAMALATVDPDGLPNVRMVLLKEISDSAFHFFTNYDSTKGRELDESGKAALVLHWKSLRRQVRVRGTVTRLPEADSDHYFASRSVKSRLGAWASHQSQPLGSRAELMGRVAVETARRGPAPARPPWWGGFAITPLEIEFWADGDFRLHDRFRWTRKDAVSSWIIKRLCP